MGFHVDLIQELPEKVLEGKTVVSQLSSVKSQKNRLYQIEGIDLFVKKLNHRKDK